MSFFTARNLQEFGKHWSSMWRHRDKKSIFSEQKQVWERVGDPARLELFPWPKPPIWPPKIISGALRKRKTGRPRIPRKGPWNVHWALLALAYNSFCIFFTKLIMQNQQGLLKSLHQPLCFTSPWYFQDLKWSKQDLKLIYLVIHFAILTPRRFRWLGFQEDYPCWHSLASKHPTLSPGPEWSGGCVLLITQSLLGEGQEVSGMTISFTSPIIHR